jgi:hypothetical protein
MGDSAKLQERVLAFVLRDPQGNDQISRSLLVQYLQHEYEVRTCSMQLIIRQMR